MKVDKSKWRSYILDDCIISLRTGLNPRKNFTLNESGATNYYITVRELNGRGITISDKTDLFCDYAFPLINHRSNLEKGDVLFSGTGSIGRTALVHETPKNWNIKEGVYVIKPKQDVLNSIFLLYYLHSAPLLEYCQTFSKGATIQSVPMAKLRSAKILLPSINQQESIASELDALQEVIAGYRAQIADLNALAQSLFLDTFGDPFLNDKNWDIVSLETLCSFISRGRSPKYKDEDKRFPVFAQKCNQKNGEMSLDLVRFLDEDSLPKWKDIYKLRDGDILINSTGNGTVGRVGLFDIAILGEYPFIVPDSHVTVVRLKEPMSQKYCFYYLKSSKAQTYFEDNLKGSTNQTELYVDTIKNTAIPIPPLTLQKEFAEQVEAIEKQKELLRQQLADAEMLMAERMQYYFS